MGIGSVNSYYHHNTVIIGCNSGTGGRAGRYSDIEKLLLLIMIVVVEMMMVVLVFVVDYRVVLLILIKVMGRPGFKCCKPCESCFCNIFRALVNS